MAGLDSRTPIPEQVILHRGSRELELIYPGGRSARLSFEFLRVHSPSAEVQGHGPGQEILQIGKRMIEIRHIEPVGYYAIRPEFSDGHVSGIYSWDLLYQMVENHDRLWADYLKRMEAAGASRDPGGEAFQALAVSLRSGGGCA